MIVEYDPRWPALYEVEKRRILEAIGYKVVSIEHIGSTAVSGLGAKPIVDMIAGIRQPNDAEECAVLLQSLGYNDVTRQTENPDWYYCLGRRLDVNTYCHLHLVRYGTWFWRKHLVFRDFLRTHPDVAQEYFELKKRLASTFGSDRQGYVKAKTAFIESVASRAIG